MSKSLIFWDHHCLSKIHIDRRATSIKNVKTSVCYLWAHYVLIRLKEARVRAILIRELIEHIVKMTFLTFIVQRALVGLYFMSLYVLENEGHQTSREEKDGKIILDQVRQAINLRYKPPSSI